MKKSHRLVRSNLKLARAIWGELPRTKLVQLRALVESHSLSVALGDVRFLDSHWYITHWSKAIELVKVARREGEDFDSATWLHKAKEMPKEGFKSEVQRHLTGKDTEPWEIIYFKLFTSQIPVVEKALEMTALMLGSDKSRGYCLEMICADFLAGAALGEKQS